MKKRNLILFMMIATLISAVSCSGADKKKEVLVTEAGVFPRYLELIPADTPYVFASTEALPEHVVDVLIEKVRPMADAMVKSSMLMQSNEIKTLWEEVGQKLFDPKGFEELGLVKSPTFVVYGVGVLPAVRVQIGDGTKVRALFKRIETRLGVSSTEETLGTQQLWSYSDSSAIAPFSIVGDELVFGVAPTNAAELFTQHLLGEVKPEKSFANANKIDQIVSEYGFMKFFVGFVDFAKVFESVSVESESLNSRIAGFIPDFRQELDPVCIQETTALIAQAPRMVFGYDKFDTKVAVARMGVEITNGLSGEVAATKTSMPIAGASIPDTMIRGGVGFDVGQLINLVQTKMSAVRDAPFQCDGGLFRAINEGARNSAALSMIPPAITKIKGASFGLRNVEQVDVSNGDPNVWPKYKNYVDGYALVKGENPRDLFNVISLVLPEFSEIKIKEDLVPVPLSLPPNVDEFKNPSVMLSNQFMALTAGMTTAQDLSKVLQNTTEKKDTPFAQATYNMGRYYEMFNRMMNMSHMSKEDKEIMNTMGTMFGGESVIELIPEERGFFMKFEQPIN